MGSVCTWLADDRRATSEPAAAVDPDELRRIRGEYLEMPGLCLTQCQAQRLWGLPCERCEALLTALIEERFLVRTADGRFIRFDDTAR